MAMHDTGMFTVKEINRLKILQDVIERNLRPGQAAEMLGITPRHCSRLLKRYRQSGPLGMNNQSRGRTGNRLLPTSLTDLALSIIRERYHLHHNRRNNLTDPANDAHQFASARHGRSGTEASR